MNRAALCFTILLATLGAQGGVAPPDPYQLYGRARAVWLSQKYPQYLSYTIAVTVSENGVVKTNHYQATYDATRNRVYVGAVSDEERTSPHVPTGINMSIDPKRKFQTLFSKHVGNAEEATDYLGVPKLAPNYSFGIVPYVPEVASTQVDQEALVREIRNQFNDPMSAGKEAALENGSDVKEIGRVGTVGREYAIHYEGLETVDGRETYHISLRPIHANAHRRLRELWVDAETSATVAAVIDGNFANNGVPWTIHFATIDGKQYIASEEALKPVGIGRHMYEKAAIVFESIKPSEAPQYVLEHLGDKNVLEEPF